ncbi:flagellar basal-body MS-ring/collar protein FliF [Sphingomonas sp. Leaf4]|uniref:flagellar basal-body MS-ring/collar protein FliF n=1 Tax=Sphingomonas sp. Leaf4 TaxID=2876553 RepID=UPI001E62812F|nr:flagellar basal-body MS-ring/collar protein FliF [Sphingomonas sp. Leaf4]
MSDAVLPSSRRQWVVIGAVFAAVVLLLGLGYFLFLRGGYVVLADGVRPGEAAAIVAELDKRGTPYDLRDGGTTILVPDDEADATRLALVRSDAAMAGQIGFELFNKSDMGLTNFAQKINYQRALQGELVRTIMAMDGVETARVHLALPERALFRDDRTAPSAAVTVAMRAGLTPDPGRVAGIQRLVSAAVADLPAERVVVLDGDGRVISQGASAAPVADAGAKGAVEQYYRARAQAAIDSARPDLRYLLRVLALPQGDTVIDPARWTPGEQGGSRDFRLRMTLVTTQAVDADTQRRLHEVVTPAVGLSETQGDVLLFETGSIDQPAAAPMMTATPRIVTTPLPTTDPVEPATGWPSAWWLALVALLVVAGMTWRRRTAKAMPEHERDAFADALRRQLAREGADDGRR